MSQEQLAIDLIVAASTMHEAETIDRKAVEAVFVVDIKRIDGKRVRYRILVTAHGTEVSAKEDGTPRRLPTFCPDRHINVDGSFCLYWSDEFAIQITDVEAANYWWITLREFLLMQERADYAREWTSDGWAHGKAARYQFDALNAATIIGKRVVAATQRQQLTVSKIETKNPANGVTLQLSLAGTQVCRVRQNNMCVTGQCNFRNFRFRRRGKATRKLGSREKVSKAYAKLTIALWNWKVAEDEYWLGHSGKECCGKLDSCRLRNQQDKRRNINV